MYKQCYSFSKSIILVETIHELIYSGCGTIPHQAGKQGKDEPRRDKEISRRDDGGGGVGTSPPGNGAERRTGKCVCCRHRDAPWREKTRSLSH